MFAAAMLYSAPQIELSIYSTCKRISQKLLRNVVKFFYQICDDNIDAHHFKIIRENTEEIVVRGPHSSQDNRIVNSYPSKVICLACAKKSLLKVICELGVYKTGW